MIKRLKVQCFWHPRDWWFQVAAWRRLGVINFGPLQILRPKERERAKPLVDTGHMLNSIDHEVYIP